MARTPLQQLLPGHKLTYKQATQETPDDPSDEAMIYGPEADITGRSPSSTEHPSKLNTRSPIRSTETWNNAYDI